MMTQTAFNFDKMKQKHSSSTGCLNWVHVLASDPVSSDASTSVTREEEGDYHRTEGPPRGNPQRSAGPAHLTSGPGWKLLLTRDQHTSEALSPPLIDVCCRDLGTNCAASVKGGIRVRLLRNIM